MSALLRDPSADTAAWRGFLYVVPPDGEDVAEVSDDEAGHGVPVAWVVPGVTPSSAPAGPSPLVAEAQRSVEALASASLSGQPADVAALLVLAERLRGLGLVALGELDATGLHAEAGAATAAAWLGRTMLLGQDSASALVRLSRRVRTDLPALGDLLVQGGTTLEHVQAVAAGTAGLDAELIAGTQQALVDLVEAAEPADVRRELRERAEAVDGDLGRQAARRQQARQGVYADAVAGGGGVVLGGSLSDEDGAVFLHGLDLAVEASRVGGDTRGLPARRAEVLVQWSRQAALDVAGPGDTAAQDAHTVRSHLLVTCTLDQLAAQQRDRDALVRGHDLVPAHSCRPGRAARPDRAAGPGGAAERGGAAGSAGLVCGGGHARAGRAGRLAAGGPAAPADGRAAAAGGAAAIGVRRRDQPGRAAAGRDTGFAGRAPRTRP